MIYLREWNQEFTHVKQLKVLHELIDTKYQQQKKIATMVKIA